MQYYYPDEGWDRVGLLSVACLVHSAQIHNHSQNASSDCWTCMSPSLSSDLTTHKSTNELDRPQPRTGLHHTHTTLPWLHFFRVHRCLELQQRSTMHLYLRSSDVGWFGVCMCMLATECVAPQGSVPGVQPESGSCQTETGQLSKSAGQLLPRTVISIGTMLYARVYVCEKVCSTHDQPDRTGQHHSTSELGDVVVASFSEKEQNLYTSKLILPPRARVLPIALMVGQRCRLG